MKPNLFALKLYSILAEHSTLYIPTHLDVAIQFQFLQSIFTY